MKNKLMTTIRRIYDAVYSIIKEDVQDSLQMNQTKINLHEWQLYDRLECK